MPENFYTFGYARIQPSDRPRRVRRGYMNYYDLLDAIRTNWHPGASTELNGRTWVLSRARQRGQRYLLGSLGFEDTDAFESFGPHELDMYDSAAAELGPDAVPLPFGIDTYGAFLAYQVDTIAVDDFDVTQALTALLSTPELPWTVEPLGHHMEYDHWLNSMQRVMRFQFFLERPNPSYGDNKLIEAIVDGINSRYQELIAQEQAGEGIRTNSDLFVQAMDHVLRDYGDASLRGLDAASRISLWRKTKHRLGLAVTRLRINLDEVEEAPVASYKASPETAYQAYQAPSEAIERALAGTPPGLEAIRLQAR